MDFYTQAFLSIKNTARLTLLLIGLMITIRSAAQQTPIALEIKNEGNFDLPKAFKKLDRSANDTAKVNLLLKVSHVYWRGKNNINHWLDSCLLFANKARTLSTTLHYTDGYTEATFIVCRHMLEKDDIKGARALAATVYGEERVRLLLIICERIIFKLGADKAYLEQAYPDLIAAQQLSEAIHSSRALYQCNLLLGKYYFKVGLFAKGKNAIMQIIKACQKEGDVAGMAHYWSELGLYMPETDTTYRDKTHCHEMAVKYYLQANNTEEAAYSLRDVVVLNFNHDGHELALKQMLQVVSMLKAAKAQIKFSTYRLLAELYRFRGEFDKAAFYIQEAFKIPDLTDNARVYGYSILGDLYAELGEYDKSLNNYQKVYDFQVLKNISNTFTYAYYIAVYQSLNGEPQKGLDFLNDYVKKHPPVLALQKQLLAAGLGDIYNQLKNYKKAEEYYLQMMALTKTVRDEASRDISYRSALEENGAEFAIGQFYAQRGRYAEAKPHLEKALLPPPTPAASRTKQIYYLLFKVDSARGEYLSAIKYLERHRVINDSLFNIAKSRQIEDLNVKYETDQKEQSIKTLQAREQQANLLRSIQQAQLEKIDLERKNQQVELREANLGRKNQQVEIQKVNLQRRNQQVELQRANLQTA
jgi:tetratricopeptide (TPR) repeat protein